MPRPCALGPEVKENGAHRRPCCCLCGVDPEPRGCALPLSLDLRSLNTVPEAGRCGPSWPGQRCCTARHITRYWRLQDTAAPSCFRVASSSQAPSCAWGDSWCFTSPHWNLCKPGNIWLGKSKMNVPSIFPVPIPSSTKKTLNEEGRGASYQRQVCSENL